MLKLLLSFFLLISPLIAEAKTRIPEPKSPGGQIMLNKCSICHATPHPKRFKFKRWPQTLDLMEMVMQERHLTLSPEERQTLLDYLRKHSD